MTKSLQLLGNIFKRLVRVFYFDVPQRFTSSMWSGNLKKYTIELIFLEKPTLIKSDFVSNCTTLSMFILR